MWLDGIETKRNKRKRSKRKPKRKNTFYTVSARVKEKRAERRRRGLTLALALIALVGLGWTLYFGLAWAGRELFSENDRFLIRHWDLRSNGILTPAHIKEYSQLSENDNLFAVDLKAVRRKLESVAIIKSVRVSRQLPDTLVVQVKERLAVARLGEERGYPLAVDREGQVLGPSSLSPRLPSIVGLRQPGLRPSMTVTDPLFADALRLLDWCDRSQAAHVIRPRIVQISHPEQIELVLDDGARVIYDRIYMEERMNELVGILQSQEGSGRVAKLINMTGDPHIPPVVRY